MNNLKQICLVICAEKNQLCFEPEDKLAKNVPSQWESWSWGGAVMSEQRA